MAQPIAADPTMTKTSTYVFVGSFIMPNPPPHEGLHVFRLEPQTGALIPVDSYVTGLNVGGFAVDAKRRILYVTDEVASTAESNGGRVFAFSIDVSRNGVLSELGRWSSYGTQPAGLTLDASGNFLAVSHFTSRATTTAVVHDKSSGSYRIEPRYGDATTVLFPLDAQGNLDPPCDIHIHRDDHLDNKGPLSCLHSISLSKDGSFLVECDMAKDRLITYAIDTAGKSFRILDVRHTQPGSGPRYSAFHPTLPIFYVNYEYHPLVEAFKYSQGGEYESVGTVDVLPDELAGGPGVLLSDLRVHPSGKYAYTLIRGHNVVSGFTVDPETGRLQRIQTAALGGLSPKGCAISPDGRWLYVAVSVSNEVQTWSIGQDGILTATAMKIAVPRPSAIAIVEFSTA
ncbi:Lactonase, 7-bladed beta-propeller-domain-containing protein [Xylariales sp. PMI_506]|nr:Lactonase, 7-bladed beta-propeller-domain-containing protein [Xylariales sp. PMI_506]